MRKLQIAAIPGDGIGQEVIAAGVRVLEACAKRDGGFEVAVDHFDWGSERYKRTGAFMPADGLAQIKGHDAILFGSAGAPDVPDHITLWGLRLAICQPFDQYANVRPTRILPGITSPLRIGDGAGARLGDRARELGRGVCGRRRACASRIAGGGGDRRVDVHARRRRAHHALCVRPGAVAAAQAPDRRHQVERPAPRHGDVGRDRGRGGGRVCRRDLGQDAGRRHDHAHGAAAAVDRHGRGDQPARRHPLRSRRRAGGLARHRADRQPQPGAQVPLHVRADPRLGLRHHGEGHRQSRSARSGRA